MSEDFNETEDEEHEMEGEDCKRGMKESLYPYATVVGAAVVGVAIGFLIGRKYQEEEWEWRNGRRWLEDAYAEAADRLSRSRLAEEAPKAIDSVRQKACHVGDKLKFW